MTTALVDPRAWNPAGPHIGPDDDDLEMLAQGDLGSAVLAMHRVGAAACEAVARAPLPDDYALIEALAKARTEFAEPLVQTVEKHVDGRAYADVLAKEIFDGAEHGALQVYRACVAKAVAPPLAVQRAGLVYGVPPEALGRYLPIAANPQSHPIALADAADRTLLAWAADVVKTEQAGSKINKAAPAETVQDYNRTEFGQEHPKGAMGRFVSVLERPAQVVGQVRPTLTAAPGLFARLRRQGYGEQAAPQVATMPAPPVTTAVEEPKPAVTTKPRTGRVGRVGRVGRTGHVGREAGQTELKATLKASLSADLKPQLQARLGANLEAALQAQREEEAIPREEWGSLRHSFTIMQPDDNAYGRIPNDVPVAWVTDAATAQDYVNAMNGTGNPGDPKWLRIGGLIEREDQPNRWDDPGHQLLMQTTADATKLVDEMPVAYKISWRTLDREGIPQDAAAVEAFAKRAGGEWSLALHDDEGNYNPALANWTAVVRSAEPGHRGDWFVVRRPEPSWEDAMAGRPAPVPHVAEFVVQDDFGEVRGNVARSHTAEGPRYYELDPNQTFEVANVATLLWNDDVGAFVDRYHLRPIDPEDVSMGSFDKADVALAERVRERVRHEPRDAEGRWARGGVRGLLVPARPQVVEAPVQAPVLARPKPRVGRTGRVGRKVAEPTPKLTADVQGRLGAKMAPKLRAALHAVLTAREQEQAKAKPTGDFPMSLDDRPIHKVMSMEEWDTFLDQHAPLAAVDAREIPLTLTGTHALNDHQRDNLDDLGVVSVLAENIVNDTMMDMGPAKGFEDTWVDDRDPHEQWNALLDRVDDYMASHNEVAHAQLRQVGGNETDQTSLIRLYVNKKPVDSQVLFYMPEDFDPDQPYTLKHIGFARKDDLAYGRNQFMMDRAAMRTTDLFAADRDTRHDAETAMINPRVSVYRADQQIWQARQDDVLPPEDGPRMRGGPWNRPRS